MHLAAKIVCVLPSVVTDVVFGSQLWFTMLAILGKIQLPDVYLK